MKGKQIMLIDIPVIKRPWNPYGVNKKNPLTDAFDQMKLMGLKNEANTINYHGNIRAFVKWLKRMGWVSTNDPNNPFLLTHPEVAWTWNYAASERRPDPRKISGFHGQIMYEAING